MKKRITNISIIFFLGVLIVYGTAGKKPAETIKTQPERIIGSKNKSSMQKKIKKLTIEKVEVDEKLDLRKQFSEVETQTKKHSVKTVNWKAFPYSPEVKFRIAHSGNKIWLKYYVSEKYIKALETKTNGDVYKDSCVEFFISLDKDHYYNFEFNCIGTKHVAYGKGRKNRIAINPELLDEIEVVSTLGDQPFEERAGSFNWELSIVIPKSIFVNSKIESFDGLKAYANFYKCGDDTSEPHYLSWNAINTSQPDFHRPEYFGEVYFK